MTFDEWLKKEHPEYSEELFPDIVDYLREGWDASRIAYDAEMNKPMKCRHPEWANGWRVCSKCGSYNRFAGGPCSSCGHNILTIHNACFLCRASSKINEPSPCGVEGHTMRDWVKAVCCDPASTHDHPTEACLSDNPRLEAYCLRCRERSEARKSALLEAAKHPYLGCPNPGGDGHVYCGCGAILLLDYRDGTTEAISAWKRHLIALAKAGAVRMRQDCFDDIVRLIGNCAKDCEDEGGKFALSCLGASIMDTGVDGFGTDPLPTSTLDREVLRARLETAKKIKAAACTHSHSMLIDWIDLEIRDTQSQLTALEGKGGTRG